MSRSLVGATVAVLAGVLASSAGATDLPRCAPHHRHHVAARRWPPAVVYGRADLRPPVYNHEDNGRYDAGDAPRRVIYGQGPSWLDGYGTRVSTYPRYGSYDSYGGSSEVWPAPIPPAGGLAVYSPGAYGPGPRIVTIPAGGGY